MPIYDYQCEACEVTWEENLTISNRDKPLKKKCPNCGEKKVKRAIHGFPGLGVDTTLTADKKTGGQFSEMMERVKRYAPKSTHGSLGGSTERDHGRGWKG